MMKGKRFALIIVVCLALLLVASFVFAQQAPAQAQRQGQAAAPAQQGQAAAPAAPAAPVITNTVKTKLMSGQQVFCNTISSPDTAACRKACEGVDYIWIELQHSRMTYQQAAALVRVIRTTKAIPFIRIPEPTESDIQKATDIGAMGIIVPMVESVEKAHNAVLFSKNPVGVYPRGIRSSGSNVDYNSNLMIAIQIESPEGVDALDEILTKEPGVDIVFAASSDLARFSNSSEGEVYYESLVKKIHDVTLKHGRFVGGPSSWASRADFKWFQGTRPDPNAAPRQRTAQTQTAAPAAAAAPATPAAPAPLRNTAKTKLLNGQQIFCNTISSPDTAACRKACQGVDYIWIEMQHSRLTFYQAEELVRVINTTSAIPLVRVPEPTESYIQKAMDMGAMGIIVPMVESPEKAQNAIKFSHSPMGQQPWGKRSNGNATSNENLLVGIQIESPEGVAALDQILTEAPDVDMVFAASGDLATFSGSAQGEPWYESLVTQIHDVTLKHGKILGGPSSWASRPDFQWFQGTRPAAAGAQQSGTRAQAAAPTTPAAAPAAPSRPAAPASPVITNKVKTKLMSGQQVFCNTISQPDTAACRTACAGVDFIWIEMQHSPLTFYESEQLVRVINTTSAIPFVRVPDATESDIQKATDMGARGIIIPMVETVEKAQNAVKFAKNPVGVFPRGRRSSGSNVDFNSNLMIAIQIESPEGVAALDEVLTKVPGIDIVFAASSDLRNFSGSAQGEAFYESLVTQIHDITLKHGKILGGPSSWASRADFKWFQGTRPAAGGAAPATGGTGGARQGGQ